MHYIEFTSLLCNCESFKSFIECEYLFNQSVLVTVEHVFSCKIINGNRDNNYR